MAKVKKAAPKRAKKTIRKKLPALPRYDFSTLVLINAFLDEWSRYGSSRDIPNFSWVDGDPVGERAITEMLKQNVVGNFRTYYPDGTMLGYSVARAYVVRGMYGYVIAREFHDKIKFGKFYFCAHTFVRDSELIGRADNFTCSKCGFGIVLPSVESSN